MFFQLQKAIIYCTIQPEMCNKSLLFFVLQNKKRTFAAKIFYNKNIDNGFKNYRTCQAST